MSVGDWVLLATLVGSIVGLWVWLREHIATGELRLKLLEQNHIPTLARQIDELPCQNHIEEIAKHTIRLEAVAERLERLERRLNSNC